VALWPCINGWYGPRWPIDIRVALVRLVGQAYVVGPRWLDVLLLIISLFAELLILNKKN